MNLIPSLFGKKKQPEPSPDAPVRPEGEPSDDVAMVDRKFEQARQAKQTKLRTWATCLAFYVGEHYRNWSKEERRMVQPTLRPWVIRLADNQIPTLVETVAAKLIKARQMPRALPATGEQNDIAAARAGTMALRHWWFSDGMALKEVEANIIRLLFGCAFYHDFWDPAKVAKMAVPQPDGTTASIEAAVGDVSCEVLSPFDVFPDPQESWDACNWVIIARRKPLAWFKDAYEDGGKVVGDSDTGSTYDALLPEMVTSTTNQLGAQDRDKSATLKIYYEKRSKQHPDGRCLHLAGKVLLWNGPLPMPHGEIPLSQFAYRYVPKTLWPQGMVEGVCDHQKYLNAAMNSLLHILRFWAFPKWLVPREARVEETAITTKPNEVVYYDGLSGAEKPSVITPPNIPGWVEGMPGLMRGSMESVTGVHQVSRASAPSGVRSGVALQILQEQDDSRIRVASELGKAGLENLSQHALETMAEFYGEERMVRTVGEGLQAESLALIGADLNGLDAYVDITEGVVDTKAAKQQTLYDLISTGIFGADFSPQMRGAILDAMDVPWLKEKIDAADQAMMQAAEGQPDPQQAAMDAQMQMQQQAHEQKMQEGQLKQAGLAAKVEQTRELGQIKLQQSQQQMMLDQQKAQQQLALAERQGEQQLAISQATAQQQFTQQAIQARQQTAMQQDRHKATLAMAAQQAKQRAAMTKAQPAAAK